MAGEPSSSSDRNMVRQSRRKGTNFQQPAHGSSIASSAAPVSPATNTIGFAPTAPTACNAIACASLIVAALTWAWSRRRRSRRCRSWVRRRRRCWGRRRGAAAPAPSASQAIGFAHAAPPARRAGGSALPSLTSAALGRCWRRRGWGWLRSRQRRGSWRSGRRGSRRRSWASRYHNNIRATEELLDIACLSTPTRAAVEIPMVSVAVPSLRLDLIPVAAIVLLTDHRVCSPPAPLQYARIAAQVVWNIVSEFICLGQGLFR